MNLNTVGGLAVSALLIGVPFGAASAADMPLKAPPPPPAPTSSWTGFYLGGSLGGLFGNESWYSNDNSILAPQGQSLGNASLHGVLGGVQAGYNYQTGQLVLGIETAWSLTDLHGQLPTIVTPSFMSTGSVRKTWIGTVVARVGITVGRALFYVGGGAAWTHDNDTLTVTPKLGPVCNPFCQSLPADPSFAGGNTPFGGTFLSGTDYSIDQHWSARLQYNYYGFGSQNIALGDPVGIKSALIIQSVIGGLNYRF